LGTKKRKQIYINHPRECDPNPPKKSLFFPEPFHNDAGMTHS
jgi:hypothetical protein